MNKVTFAEKIVFTIVWAVIIYLLGSIIAYDFNPKNWWFLGRIIYILVITYIAGHYFFLNKSK